MQFCCQAVMAAPDGGLEASRAGKLVAEFIDLK